MPIATAAALAGAVLGVRLRERLLAPVGGDPGWLAALAGGLAAGLVGSLVEDSGPVLLLVAVFALGCVLSYLWGRPPKRTAPAPDMTSSDPRPGSTRSAAARTGLPVRPGPDDLEGARPGALTPRSPDTPRAARSRALRRSAARAR